MQPTWLVLLPPLVVLVLAIITRRLNSSLIAGLCSGALIATNFSLAQAPLLLATRLWSLAKDTETLYSFIYLIFVGCIIALLSQTGGALAFAKMITKRLRNKTAVESSSFLLSLTLFIDDYLNALTVGYVMRSLTDQFKIARVKLAFLLRSMTGPLVILAPISSWVAIITGQLESAGISATAPSARITTDAFFSYISAIPFIFYSLLLLPTVWFMIRRQISYGPMHTHEIIAATTGNLFGGKEPIQYKFTAPDNNEHSIADLLIPICTLISAILIGILYAGGYHLFGGTHSLLDAFRNNTQTAFVLLCSGIFTLLVSLIFAHTRKKITLAQLPRLVREGVDLMLSSITMLFLAIAFGIMLREDLGTGSYLAHILLGSVSINLLPLMFFIVSLIIALSIGTAWGTMALMFPIAVPMLIQFSGATPPLTAEQLPLLLPVLGAILSGAVAGNNISPIADTTVMVSSSSGCYLIDHVQTQLPYVLPPLIGTAVAYTLVGLLIGKPLWLMFTAGLCSGLFVCYALVYILNRVWKK